MDLKDIFHRLTKDLKSGFLRTFSSDFTQRETWIFKDIKGPLTWILKDIFHQISKDLKRRFLKNI